MLYGSLDGRGVWRKMDTFIFMAVYHYLLIGYCCLIAKSNRSLLLSHGL